MQYLTIYMVVSVVSAALLLYLLVHPRVRLRTLQRIGVATMLIGNVATILQIWSGAQHYDALINSGLLIRFGLLLFTVAVTAFLFQKLPDGDGCNGQCRCNCPHNREGDCDRSARGARSADGVSKE